MSTIVIKGFGPNVRLVSGSNATVKIVTKQGIRTVPVTDKGTSVAFQRAA